ncbi:SDR family oxidoreductase [Methyloceanibacter sp.]|uniref:SDR family oxidoreductase n=1 Tax=Methyloceanibacter sp. TaxID=1965321 RepID=UPI003C72F311
MPEMQNHATALVTGAALRLGRAIALDLATLGWRIGVHYQTSSTEAESLVEEIERLGSKALALPADLTSEAQLRGLVQSCAEELGPPTCLINNAARFEWDSIDTLDWAGWQAELDVNLRAPIFLIQEFARTLPKDGSGCVINMIDQRVWRLTPEFFSYTIAKSALWTATRTLAQALAPRIRVNAIGPGPVLPSLRQSQEDFERECRAAPLGRAATVEEVCRAVRFLLDSPSVTGQMIALDSGQHLAWDGAPGAENLEITRSAQGLEAAGLKAILPP